MEKDLTLLIMAAGMGSRFGGLKQIEPVGPNGEFIIDYSIYDAVRAGFNKVVFIIKEENYELFKETIGSRVEKQIKVEYAFQRQTDIPEGYDPGDRTKPWGTSHAILSAKNNVKGDFLVLNADDFYGSDAFKQAAKFFSEDHPNEYAIIGYKIKNTLTENGAVKRGVCASENGFLTKLIESSVEEKDGHIIASPLDGSEPFEIQADDPVSMNAFCFRDDLFPYLQDHLVEFFEKNKEDLSKCEYLIPDSVYNSVKEGRVKVRLIPTTAKWQGITYKEDKQRLVDDIQKLIDEGEYPERLWN
ncbi:MAG: nucleotidyltransferase [Bacilli bacterium]|nr:nucleotidyltransferase [Bacilli bacterium]